MQWNRRRIFYVIHGRNSSGKPRYNWTNLSKPSEYKYSSVLQIDQYRYQLSPWHKHNDQSIVSDPRPHQWRETLLIGGEDSTRLCYTCSPLLGGHPVTDSHGVIRWLIHTVVNPFPERKSNNHERENGHTTTKQSHRKESGQYEDECVTDLVRFLSRNCIYTSIINGHHGETGWNPLF